MSTQHTAAEYQAELTVSGRTQEAEGVVSLTLRHPDGRELPAWQPGAHIDLLLDGSRTRQYSLCGDPEDRSRWQIAVLREPDGVGRGGSAHVHATLTEGERVQVRGPRNHFELRPARRYLFVAGGIGITPLLPMLAAAEAAGGEWTLLYGGRTRGSMAFLDRLTALDGGRGRITVAPQDETGLLDLDRALAAAGPDTLVYCCGPGPLLDAIEDRCRTRPPGTLRTERFTARPADPDAVSDAFELVLQESGLTLTVAPGASILQTVLDAGVQVLYSCTEGTCGTCETEIVEGEADHRDSVLSAEEQAANETMMICVSRCRGRRLMLDL
ncbi:PDR/VanB family oxidoreductase [Streptacidiphilus carbonis]|uniref:PDR/VanB family oxidoreductase n=1 Tax=Streptacidiphilus carbonis TaxID=105422 RepID=UPI0005A7EBD2|nr:PDR/VanB family oxidoreductase [Streptacidiphilus carbonis]